MHWELDADEEAKSLTEGFLSRALSRVASAAYKRPVCVPCSRTQLISLPLGCKWRNNYGGPGKPRSSALQALAEADAEQKG